MLNVFTKETTFVLSSRRLEVTFLVMCLEDKTFGRPFSLSPTCLLSDATATFLKEWSLSASRLRKAGIHVWVSRLGDNGEHSWINVEPHHTLGDFLHLIPNDSIYKQRLVMSLLTNESLKHH